MPKAAKRGVEATLDPATQWITTISTYDREFKKWEGRTDKILRRYRDEQRSQSSRDASARFNILWSNVQTAIPAVFSRLPKPDVSRRHRDNDPVGRVAALILERGLEFEVDHYPDYRAAMKNCVQDRFLGGRGVAWVRYEPHIKALEGTPQDGVQITEDADELESAEPQEELETESAPTDYVHWKDFGHTIARTWEEVTGVWRKVYMGRDALVDRFGEEGHKIPLDTKPAEKKETNSETPYQAVIYEIWDKPSRTALWLSKSLGKIIDERSDPLQLENFWPCPRPLFATLTTESLVPVPDFTLYQDQAKTLDVLAERIDGLVQMLQVKGVYDASVPELARLFTEGTNGTLIPVKNWLAFAEKQGLKGAIEIADLTPIYNALKEAYAAVEQQKAQVYEITGLADIIRGSTDPDETATAQKMKGQFGSMRLRSMQNDVALFATELLQIKAQIMCRLFQPETLAKIAAVDTLQEQDKALVPQALQMLKNAPLRDFRIDVVADSLVQMDEAQEKEDRAEFLKAVSSFMKDAGPAAAENPQMAPAIAEMLKFGVTGFKVGKTLEGVLDALADRLKQAAQNPQPKVDPKIAAIQADHAAEIQRMQMEQQRDQQEMANKQSYDQWKAQLDAQAEQAKQALQAQQVAQQNDLEARRQAQQADLDARLEAHKESIKQATQQAQAAYEQNFERWKTEQDNQAKIAVAEIAKSATLKAAELAAAKAEAEGGTIKDKKDSGGGPPIHIHMPSGNKKIKKNPDGSYQSEDA
jgi:hypothetical protein